MWLDWSAWATLHPTRKPDQLRVEHLRAIRTPTLILQGERDAFGGADEVPGYGLSSKIRIHWLPDGDHSFKPRALSGRTLEENWRVAIESMVSFFKHEVGCASHRTLLMGVTPTPGMNSCPNENAPGPLLGNPGAFVWIATRQVSKSAAAPSGNETGLGMVLGRPTSVGFRGHPTCRVNTRPPADDGSVLA